MSLSAGTGSPIFFRCHADRTRQVWHPRGSTVELTGRTRPYPRRRYHALGTRSVMTSYEYRCSCGYVGWSNHVDLAQLAGDEEALRRSGFRKT